MWCPSHLLDKDLPADAKAKYAKASAQPGWQDGFMQMNAVADTLATEALNSASGLHAAIASREAALVTAQEASAHIGTAVAERLLSARLPEASRGARTLTAHWEEQVRNWAVIESRPAQTHELETDGPTTAPAPPAAPE